jgi:hypothetical protein
MSMARLRVEDRLAGVGNWSPWKAIIVLILEFGRARVMAHCIYPNGSSSCY